jgi:hypothetical protein
MDPIGAIIGMVMLVAIALYAAIGIQSSRSKPKGTPTASRTEADVEAARRRAIAWATPECTTRLSQAVSRARTEFEVQDLAWASCPNHPDALE